LLYRLLKYKGYKNLLFSSGFYLVIAGITGPGLIVNYIFKENFGRARPAQTTNFNGSKNFSPALYISNQCYHNCSFSSGHAAMAYYFTALAYTLALYNLKKSKELHLSEESSLLSSSLLHKKKNIFTITYIIVLVFGSVVGFSRILMGGHFLSDVVASCWIVLSVNYLLYLWWQKLRSI
jgi:lipid A 4'-phosphatase